MKKNIAYFLSLTLLFSLAAGVLFSCKKNEPLSPAPATEEKAEAGYKAPDFQAALLSGESFKLSEQTGKTIVLNFWATWCGYCVKEMPYFEELSAEYGEEVRFIGINVGESQKKVEEFINQKGFTFDIVLDPDETVSRKYPTDAIPLTVIVKPDGTVAKTVLGARAKDEWKEIIDSAMKN